MRLQQNSSDHTNREGEMIIVAVYVDDILLACNSMKKMEQVKKELGGYFKVNDLGELTYFLGVKIIQTKTGSIWLGQKLYTESVLK